MNSTAPRSFSFIVANNRVISSVGEVPFSMRWGRFVSSVFKSVGLTVLFSCRSRDGTTFSSFASNFFRRFSRARLPSHSLTRNVLVLWRRRLRNAAESEFKNCAKVCLSRSISKSEGSSDFFEEQQRRLRESAWISSSECQRPAETISLCFSCYNNRMKCSTSVYLLFNISLSNTNIYLVVKS